MDKGEAYEIAQEAVKELVKERGGEASFPLDAIWDYAREMVPSTQRPHVWKPLVRDGYLELTGGMTRASSPERAGSPTREYRPGPRFRRTSKRAGRANDKTVAAAVIDLTDRMEENGFLVSSPEMANFYLALKSSPLVILAGLSGTGKSRLPRLFAQLTGAMFKSIPVKPQWSDNTDLFGYSPTLSPSRFVEGPLTEALREAASHPEYLYVLLLDEMNLAPVEHYLSDFISVVETRRREGAAVTTDPLPLELPPAPVDGSDPFEALRGMPIPSNTKIVGSANMDETTRPFSPKVLDRAFAIEFDEVDLTTFPNVGGRQDSDLTILSRLLIDASVPINEMEAYGLAQELFDYVAALLEEMRKILGKAGISFGYRTRQAIILYLYAWKKDALEGVLSANAAFDFCILQKVLPKIQGTAESLRQALEELAAWLDESREEVEAGMPAGPFVRSADKVRRMLRSLENEGFTNFWSA